MKDSIIHSISRATICQPLAASIAGDRFSVSAYLSSRKSKSCPHQFLPDRILVDGGNDSKISESKVNENLNVVLRRPFN